MLPALSFDALVRAIEPAMVLALVGSADTLLTALVGDSMTRARHDPNKELFAQGLGAVVTGFIQGLPGSGATPSTIANIRAGGTTLVAGVIAVVILVVMILALEDYVAKIPNALLAGVLMKVALDTIEWRFVTRLLRIQREHMVVMLLTLGLTVFLDLVTAIAVGMIAAAVTSARQFERLELDSVVSVPISGPELLRRQSERGRSGRLLGQGWTGCAERLLYRRIVQEAVGHHWRRHP